MSKSPVKFSLGQHLIENEDTTLKIFDFLNYADQVRLGVTSAQWNRLRALHTLKNDKIGTTDNFKLIKTTHSRYVLSMAHMMCHLHQADCLAEYRPFLAAHADHAKSFEVMLNTLKEFGLIKKHFLTLITHKNIIQKINRLFYFLECADTLSSAMIESVFAKCTDEKFIQSIQKLITKKPAAVIAHEFKSLIKNEKKSGNCLIM